jgi:hypothetical protein
MNLIEMLFFALAIVLSVLFGRYLFAYVGWWGILPALMLGFGLVIGLIWALNKILERPNQTASKQ